MNGIWQYNIHVRVDSEIYLVWCAQPGALLCISIWYMFLQLYGEGVWSKWTHIVIHDLHDVWFPTFRYVVHHVPQRVWIVVNVFCDSAVNHRTIRPACTFRNIQGTVYMSKEAYTSASKHSAHSCIIH